MEDPMQLHVENMTCGGCVRGVTRAIQDVDAKAEVVADLDRREIAVKTDLEREKVVIALLEAGFQAA
jgi:copper chaperone